MFVSTLLDKYCYVLTILWIFFVVKTQNQKKREEIHIHWHVHGHYWIFGKYINRIIFLNGINLGLLKDVL